MRHSMASSGPAARWIAPSTPPPPSSDALAALTIASTCSLVMSPGTEVSFAIICASIEESNLNWTDDNLPYPVALYKRGASLFPLANLTEHGDWFDGFGAGPCGNGRGRVCWQRNCALGRP